MIDPIPLKEELARIADQRNALRSREEAGQALSWFDEFALSPSKGGPRVPEDGVLDGKLKPIASSTPNADKAAIYLSRAFRAHHRSIIEAAIRLAKEDIKA